MWVDGDASLLVDGRLTIEIRGVIRELKHGVLGGLAWRAFAFSCDHLSQSRLAASKRCAVSMWQRINSSKPELPAVTLSSLAELVGARASLTFTMNRGVFNAFGFE